MTGGVMEQDRAFIEAIRDDPGDDLHRLAWADWLDDRGDTRRADFIRAQVRLAALDPDDPARDDLEDEADDLLAGHDHEWAGRVGELAEEWSWRRGCVERVTLWADALLTHGEELFALAPIREVRLLMETGDAVRLAACPLLRYVETLDLGRDSPESFLISAYQRDRPLQHLFASPHLSRLQCVRLRGQGVEGPLIETLIDTGLLARLHELDVANNHALGDRAARLLVSGRSNTLRRLDVQGTNLSVFGVRQLLRSRSWPALTRLDLNAALLFSGGLTAGTFQNEWAETALGPQLTNLCFSAFAMEDESLDVILGWNELTRLEELTLWGCRLTASSAERLAGCANLSGVRSLHLGNNQIRDAGARALAGSPHLARLSSLRLTGNGIGGPGIRAVAALVNLRELDLSGNYVGSAGAEALAEGKLRRLRRLDLSDGNLDAEAARRLAGAKALRRLRVLRLGNNPLGDSGVAALAGSPHLGRLRELSLDSCGLDEAGVRALTQSPHLDRVARLGLRNTFVSGRDREQLQVRFGPGAEF
jgi:uncharacterized protein (TIGR02996 family)